MVSMVFKQRFVWASWSFWSCKLFTWYRPGTRLSSTAANVPHLHHVGCVALPTQDTPVAAGTTPRNPFLPRVLLSQKPPLSVGSCMRPNQPCTGSGMAIQLSMHQAVVRSMYLKMAMPTSIVSCIIIPPFQLNGQLSFSTLFASKNLKLYFLFFRQCWRTFCNYCDCLKLFWKLPPLDWKWKFGPRQMTKVVWQESCFKRKLFPINLWLFLPPSNACTSF